YLEYKRASGISRASKRNIERAIRETGIERSKMETQYAALRKRLIKTLVASGAFPEQKTAEAAVARTDAHVDGMRNKWLMVAMIGMLMGSMAAGVAADGLDALPGGVTVGAFRQDGAEYHALPDAVSVEDGVVIEREDIATEQAAATSLSTRIPQPWDGYLRAHVPEMQAEGDEPGYIAHEPLMCLTSQRSTVPVLWEWTVSGMLGAVTEEGSSRYIFMDERGRAIEGESAEGLIAMIRAGDVKEVRDNRDNIRYRIERPEVVWMNRTNFGDWREISSDGDLIPAATWQFYTKTEYLYNRALGYRENGYSMKAYQTFSDAMVSAARKLGLTGKDLEEFNVLMERKNYTGANNILKNYAQKVAIPGESSVLVYAEKSSTIMNEMRSEWDAGLKVIEDVAGFLFDRIPQIVGFIPGEAAYEYGPVVSNLFGMVKEIDDELDFNLVKRKLDAARNSGRAVMLKNVPVGLRDSIIDPLQTLLNSKVFPLSSEGVVAELIDISSSETEIVYIPNFGGTIYVGNGQGTLGLYITYYEREWYEINVTGGVKYKAHIPAGTATVTSVVSRAVTEEGEGAIVFLPERKKAGEDVLDTIGIIGKNLLRTVASGIFNQNGESSIFPEDVNYYGRMAAEPVISGVSALIEGVFTQGEINKILEKIPAAGDLQNRFLEVFEPGQSGEYDFTEEEWEWAKDLDREQKVLLLNLSVQLKNHKALTDGIEGMPLGGFEKEKQEKIVDAAAVSILGHAIFSTGEENRDRDRINRDRA
ncbi:MAG: hypothetical protein ABIH74_00550, partial [Candidatus Omnitrophota bacterium]